MKTKHTQGQWKATKNNTLIYSEKSNSIIAELYGSENEEADAKLIASAPELLEALKEISNAIAVGLMPMGDVQEICVKAIKKGTL